VKRKARLHGVNLTKMTQKEIKNPKRARHTYATPPEKKTPKPRKPKLYSLPSLPPQKREK
jgi:hypothetical protein